MHAAAVEKITGRLVIGGCCQVMADRAVLYQAAIVEMHTSADRSHIAYDRTVLYRAILAKIHTAALYRLASGNCESVHQSIGMAQIETLHGKTTIYDCGIRSVYTLHRDEDSLP